MLWTALASFIGGQGVEWWFNGFERFPGLGSRAKQHTSDETISRGRKLGDSEYVSVNREASSGSEIDLQASVNGEKVESEMAREKKIQLVRTVVAGLGFMMGVVGIWGDGA